MYYVFYRYFKSNLRLILTEERKYLNHDSIYVLKKPQKQMISEKIVNFKYYYKILIILWGILNPWPNIKLDTFIVHRNQVQVFQFCCRNTNPKWRRQYFFLCIGEHKNHTHPIRTHIYFRCDNSQGDFFSRQIHWFTLFIKCICVCQMLKFHTVGFSQW